VEKVLKLCTIIFAEKISMIIELKKQKEKRFPNKIIKFVF